MSRFRIFFSSRYTLALTSLCALQGGISPVFADGKNIEEAFFLRHIAETWKAGKYADVKQQILTFLEKENSSSLRDPLQAMLGDIAFQEGNYTEALAAYGQIQGEEFKEKTLLNHLDALFQVNEYAPLLDQASAYLEKNREPDEKTAHVRFLQAEVHFREAIQSQDLSQKESLLQEAKSHYELLQDTAYEDLSLLPRAELHQMLGEYPEAADIYLELAEKERENREAFLFHAASLQVKNDKAEAVNTFSKIAREKGAKAPLAAFNWLALLYETARYEELLGAQTEILSLISPEKLPTAQFYLGKSHYSLENFTEAASTLQEFLATAQESSPYHKSALCLLINCAERTENSSLFAETLEKLEKNYSNDLAYAEALLMQTHREIEKGELKEAERDLQKILSSFPEHELKEALMHDSSLLTQALEKTDSSLVENQTSSENLDQLEEEKTL